MRAALDEALVHRQAIEHREDSFVAHFRLWLESPDHRSVTRPYSPSTKAFLTTSFSISLPKPHRDHVQAIYNAHMHHSTSVDPFKLALYKLMGKLDPSKRNIPLVTTTTEDWLWFQLAMVFFILSSSFLPTHRACVRSMRKKMVVCVGLRRCCSTMESVISRVVARRERVLAYGLPCF